jgi:hypothetical protein
MALARRSALKKCGNQGSGDALTDQGSRNQEGPPRRAALNCSPQETGDQSSEIDARAGIEEVESVQRHGSMMETTVDQVELG